MRYTVSVIANVTIVTEVEAENAEQAKTIVDAMQYEELQKKPFRIYSTEEVDINEDINAVASEASYELVEIYCGLSTEKWSFANMEDALAAFEKRLKDEFPLSEKDLDDALEKREFSFITGYSLSIV